MQAKGLHYFIIFQKMNILAAFKLKLMDIFFKNLRVKIKGDMIRAVSEVYAYTS